MIQHINAIPSRHSLPDLQKIAERDFVTELKALLESSTHSINELLNRYSSEGATFEPNWDFMYHLESIEVEISKFWNKIQHINNVCESLTERKTYQEGLNILTQWYTAFGQNLKLYQWINKAIHHPNFAKFTQPQQIILQNKFNDFKLSGVGLEESKQHDYQIANTQVSQISTQFQNNILDSSKANSILVQDQTQLKGLPNTILNAASAAAKAQGSDGWLFELNGPNYRTVLTTADHQKLRADFYKAWVTRASEFNNPLSQAMQDSTQSFDNGPLIFKILSLRHQMSQLTGFNNYAERSLSHNKMAKTSQTVLDFLNQLLGPARATALKELQTLQHFAEQQGHVGPLCDWDIAYFSEKLKLETFGVNEETLKKYFSLPQVLTGLFKFLKQLFKLDIQEIPDIKAWDSSVQVFEVRDSKEHLRGYIYFDLYTRSHKREGAWMDDCQGRRLTKDFKGIVSVHLPIAFLNCNFETPPLGKSALLTHNDVLTLFHEMGHVLHHVLTQVDYAEVSGINGVPWDAVEIPSQFLENFAWEPEVLKLINKELPDNMLESLQRSRTFQAGLQLIRQLEFALFDLQLHVNFDPNQPISQIQTQLDRVREQTRILPTPEFNRFQNSFSHIFGGGYAAGYYSYLWAEVFAADAFNRFKEEGIFNIQAGQDFMNTIFAWGGAVPMSQLFENFRGRPLDQQAFLIQRGVNTSGS